MIIRNTETLTSHGNIDGRKTLLDVIDAGLKAADPYPNVKKILRIEDGKLLVGQRDFAGDSATANVKFPLEFDLSRVGNIYLFGGGKAVQRIAQAVEDILGDLVTDGQINAKRGEAKLLKRVNVTFAGHPIPDEGSVEGSNRRHEIEKKIKKGDVVFFFSSGGGSATSAWPPPGITLKDLQEVTRMLYFVKGASMPETNAVRGKLRMPRAAGVINGATMISISSSETPPGGRELHRRFPSTDAIEILKRYSLWDKVPQSVRTHLEKVHNDPRYNAYAFPIHSCFTYDGPHYSFRAIGPEYMLEGARKRAEELGVHAYIISSSLNDIEASNVGQTLASIVREVERNNRPFEPPCIIILGGELTVATGEATGKGGRNQEFALSTALGIEGSKNIVVASCDCDGADGPTDAAGGIVDGYTMERANQIGIDVFEELSNHNSYGVLTKLDDAIFTGVLGQNLRSLSTVYVKKTS
jgi:glycerate 2-kinase